MPSAEVYILGQKYTVKGDASEAHLRELAKFIEGKVEDICKGSTNITAMKALILTAFDLAEELHMLKAQQEDIANEIEQKTAVLTALFEGQ